MLCALAAGAVALSACGAAEHSSTGANGGGGGGGASGGGSAAAGGTTTGGAPVGNGGTTIDLGGQPGESRPQDRACAAGANANGSPPLFCGHDVWNTAPATRELYSWTTAEQAAELRRDGVLFTRTERPGMGPGYAFTYLASVADAGWSQDYVALANGLISSFDKARYAWPSPWATRMGWPGEDYGDQLVRILLKPDAWIVVVEEPWRITVIDMNNKSVPVADALASMDRIGAIYFIKTDGRGNGSFFECSGGYREFILGNLAMIEEWSIATEAIRTRIEADAALIEALRLELEPAPPVFDPTTFNRMIACRWGDPVNSDLDRYERSLAIPSEYYIPTPDRLATLRDTLRASLFTPNPFVVKPGR